MNIEDFLDTWPDRIVIPAAVENTREPPPDIPSSSAHTEGYVPMPTPPPLWPRVFPGL